MIQLRLDALKLFTSFMIVATVNSAWAGDNVIRGVTFGKASGICSGQALDPASASAELTEAEKSALIEEWVTLLKRSDRESRAEYVGGSLLRVTTAGIDPVSFTIVRNAGNRKLLHIEVESSVLRNIHWVRTPLLMTDLTAKLTLAASRADVKYFGSPSKETQTKLRSVPAIVF